MDLMHKEILRKHRSNLADQILVSDTIVPFLYQEHILTATQMEEIDSQITNKRKTLKLLDILPNRGPEAFDMFVTSLKEEYSWVRDYLLNELESQPATGHSNKDQHQLPEAILQHVPSDRELSHLASLLGPEWESVLLHLGLSTGALFRCRADHAHSLHSQVLAGLVKWRQTQGRRATVRMLFQSLHASDVHPSVLDEVFPGEL